MLLINKLSLITRKADMLTTNIIESLQTIKLCYPQLINTDYVFSEYSRQ